jgi:PKD domain
MKGLASAVVLLIAIAAQGDCVSSIDLISARASEPNRVAGPIAWTGTHLAIAKTENAAPRPIWIELRNAEGHVVREVKAIDATTAPAQALLWTGQDLGLFFDPVGRVRYQRLAADGTPIGGVVELPHLIFADDEFDYAWDPTRDAHLVLHRVTQGPGVGLWLTAIGRDGSVKFDRLLYSFLADVALPKLAVAANGTIAVFFIHASIPGTSMLRVDAQERFLAPVTIAPTTPFELAVAARGNQIGVARQVPTTGGRTEIRWVVVDTNAAVVVSDRLLVSPRGLDVAPVSLVAAPDEWALGYNDSQLGFREHAGEYRLHRFTQTGAQISNTVFTIERVRATVLSRHPLVWNGSAYVSTVSQFVSTTQGSDSYLLRHCPLIGLPQADRNIVRLLDTVNFTASASGGLPGYRFEWDFGDNSRSDSGPTIAHRFDRYGTYTVTLTTTDDAGGRSVTTLTVQVVRGKNRAVR